MRLGIDAREIQSGAYTGIGKPLVNFLEYFSTIQTNDECVLFSSSPIQQDFGKNVRNVVIAERTAFVWDQIILPVAVRQEAIDLFYSPYYKIPLLAPCCKISSVLDLMYLVFDEYKDHLGPFKRMYYLTFGRNMVRSADKVLTCSLHSKDDIIRLYGIDERKIEIIPLSIGDEYRPVDDRGEIDTIKKRFHIESRYILYVGNLKPHKNVARLIQAFSKIACEFDDLQLVLAAPKEFLYHDLIQLAVELGIGERVIFTGRITSKDKPHLLYNGAELFVFPSLYEGFGLPPVEAMASGVAVVASNTTSIPEVVGDAGVLVDPMDVDAIADAIRSILIDSKLKKSLIKKGLRRAEGFRCKYIAGRMYEFFKRIAYGKEEE